MAHFKAIRLGIARAQPWAVERSADGEEPIVLPQTYAKASDAAKEAGRLNDLEAKREAK